MSGSWPALPAEAELPELEKVGDLGSGGGIVDDAAVAGAPRAPRAVAVVEAPVRGSGDLEVGELVMSDGDDGGAEGLAFRWTRFVAQVTFDSVLDLV
jgi:hypothetical protein